MGLAPAMDHKPPLQPVARPPIAPAVVSGTPKTRAGSSSVIGPSGESGVQQPGPPKSGMPKLSVSKQWVLPPRPKPGRKPRPKPRTSETSSSTNDSRSSAPRTPTDATVASSTASAKLDSTSTTGDDCGLCDHNDGCMCSNMGIKSEITPDQSPAVSTSTGPAPLRHPPHLALILDTAIVQPAVPLKRPPNPTIEPSKKFQRIEQVVLPTPPSHAHNIPNQHVPPLNSQDHCGFCQEGTPCMCADTEPSDVKQITESVISIPEQQVEACAECQKGAMSMLFCLSLGSAQPLDSGAVSIPCHLAFKTLEKHTAFASCDLGGLVRHLQVRHKSVGVQSINRVLQALSRQELTL